MTRGEDEDIEGELRKFLDTQKGDSENLYTSKPTGGGGRLLKNWTASEGGLLKFQTSSLNILKSPPPSPRPSHCHIKWTFP